ncbi:hypothetical protein QLL95_gp0422 [Cotonvirus japonicus]|uniref:Uncharacterized protein n=1 Tax=Cotonvirus japonicus TaxID=2811091 RepID=A0ABM7NUF5_9VIRU|nr:hypothetical protein QLL95_gp0422 [Cotonvirus japonicus]BCS83701.1 hypothetical protein [Cotonvirus japonicus]
MASVIIINSIISGSDSEEEKKNKYQYRKKINQLNDKFLLNAHNEDDRIGMGFMLYKLNNEYGIEISKYNIIQAGYDIDEIYEKLKECICHIICNNQKSNIIIYQIKGINPSLVSYDIVVSSNYPFVRFKTGYYRNYLYYINGDKTLMNKIYKKIPNLLTYRKYYNSIVNLNKKNLSEIYVKTFNKKTPKIFPKAKMRNRLAKFNKNIIFR